MSNCSSTPSPVDPPRDVEFAISRIEAKYRLGQWISAELSSEDGQSRRDIRAMARSLATRYDQVCRLLQFVDPVRGYTVPEIERLSARCRHYRRALPISTLFMLLTVRKAGGLRDHYEERCIAERWSRGKLRAQIKNELGQRGGGGRKPTRPTTADDLFGQFLTATESWCRRVGYLRQLNGSPSIEELWNPIQSQLLVAVEEMTNLLELLTLWSERPRGGIDDGDPD